MHSPDFQLLTKRQRKELTELCAQTMSSLRWKSKSPKGSEVSQLIPKVLSVEFVIPKELKTDKKVSVSGSDSDSDSDATRPKFNARDATLFAEMAKQVSIRQVESNIEWLDQHLVTQQVMASTPIVYTEDIHEALNGGGLRSMTDSEHDMVCLTFTNDSFTHWAVSCSLQYRSTESNMLNKHDSVLWFDDLEDGGALKRFNQTSFFTKLSKKWKFYSQVVIIMYVRVVVVVISVNQYCRTAWSVRSCGSEERSNGTEMPPLHARLLGTDEPDSESVIYGIIGSLFLLLPQTVRDNKIEDVLRKNGFCFLSSLEELTVVDLESLGVVKGHALMVLKVLRPPMTPSPMTMTPSPLQQRNVQQQRNETEGAPNNGMPPHIFRTKCRAFPSVLSRRTWRAFMLTFVMVLRSIGLSDPIPDAVLAAGLRPEATHTPMDAVSSGLVWDTLLSVEGGLPDDILLGFPEVVVSGRDGEAAVRYIGLRLMTTSDESIATLSTWYNDPTPVTKTTAVAAALDEWHRVLEQLTEYGAAPSLVQQRISLMTLMGRVPEITRAFEALQAVSGVMDLKQMVAAVRRVGDKATSVVSQKRAVAMMMSTHGDGEEQEKPTALVAAKRRKHGRCKFHDAGHCKFGERCRFHHIGEAGNGHPPPPGHSAAHQGAPPTQDGSAGEGDDDTAVAHLAGILSKLLRGVSASCGCSVSELVSVIVGRLQTIKTRSEESVGDGTPLGEPNASAVAGDVNVNEADNTSADAAALVSVVCDTAATMPVVGADLIGALAQHNKTPVSVALDTADGTVTVTEAVDVPGARGLMQRSLVVEGCSRSLCPVVTVCANQNLGFQIDQGATGARFLAGEETFLECQREGDFFVFDVPLDSGYDSCEEGPEGVFVSSASDSEVSEWQCVECTDQHQAVLGAAGSSLQSAFVAKFDLGATLH